jgi:uncharacterized membrane protein HdeD (DUF308 family)
MKKEIEMQTNNENQKRVFPFGGILLILAGLFLLVQQFVEINLSGGAFLATLGLFFILWGATQRKAGLLIPGGILSGLSLGVFLTEETNGLIASHLEGGVVVLCLAAGFALITLLTQLFTEEKGWWGLIVSGILALVGAGIIIVESPDTGALKDIVENAFRWLNYLWPLVLIGLGIKIIIDKRDESA